MAGGGLMILDDMGVHVRGVKQRVLGLLPGIHHD